MSKISALLGGLALAAVVASPAVSQTYCNMRGQYCNLPTWAANAFSPNHAKAPAYANLPTSPEGRTYAATRTGKHARRR